MHILLVEDDKDLNLECQAYLVRRGHDVTSCGSLAEARSAMALMSAAAPDAVVCDVNLPDGSGVDFCVEAAPVLFASRWVLMSGDPDDSEIEAKLGAIPGPRRWQIVEKPFSLRVLLDLVRT